MALNFIKASGNIITEDFCNSLAIETKADYVKDKSFGDSVKKIDEIIATTFEKLRERWEENRTSIINNSFDNSNLRQKWTIPFLKELGFDPIFIASNIKSASGIEYQIPYKGWDADFAPLIQMVNSSQDLDDKDRSSRTHSNKSPQDCLQQFLNTSDHQWAILTNGKKIRIVRDFYHSITKGFLEFDLEGIFETANSEQFRILYRVLHKSRFENQYRGVIEQEFDEDGNVVQRPDNCLLELFHKKAKETGIKVGNKLREQVIFSIELLGNGFAENLNPDDFQKGQVKVYYAEILNIIYRFLFLMFAEQKGWLPVRNSIYARTYSINSLKERAARGNYSHDEESDIWEGLKITFKLVTKGYKFKNGEKVNAFGGQLFSDRKLNTVINLKIKNKYILDAIYQLSFFKSESLINKINYANLAIDELGSVYESLLDYEPKLAKEATSVGNKQISRGTFYLDDRGTDRKTSGSYYTDSRLVAQLIDSALVPVIENAINNKSTQYEKESALLDLKVADIACGSGAFLCAALEKMGEYLAIIRMGDEDRPTDEQLREAKRDVLLHCIYGVDLNPMALELAKFSLWITASLPDMPLSFLDHKLKFGNSLIGATRDLVKKGIPVEAYKEVGNDNKDTAKWLREKVKKELTSLAKGGGFQSTLDLRVEVLDSTEEVQAYLELLSNEQETPEEVEAAENEYYTIKKHLQHSLEWRLADAWTASFFIEKTDLQKVYPTNETLYNIRNGLPVNEILLKEIEEISHQHHFFHYHLEFPEVFEKGGFDCLLGNPPWEKIKIQEKEFFNSILSRASNKVEREIILNDLKQENNPIYLEFIHAKNSSERCSHYYRFSGAYNYGSLGDINLYALFAEIYYWLLNKGGLSGFIVPPGIATDDTYKEFIQFLVGNNALINFYNFTNRGYLFREVESTMSFALYVLQRDNLKKNIQVAAKIWQVEHLKDENRIYTLDTEDIELLNPNTKNLPIFENKLDAEIVKKIYKNIPVLSNETSGFKNSWDIKFGSMLHMTNDSTLFRTLPQLEYQNYDPGIDGNIVRKNGHTFVPVYESKLIQQFNHRAATFEGIPEERKYITRAATNIPTSKQLKDENWTIQPRYWIEKTEIEKRIPETWKHNWLIGYRNAINVIADSRSTTAAIIPRFGVGNSMPLIYPLVNPRTSILLLANFNCLVLDYVTRQKASGGNLNFYVVKQLPFIPIEEYTQKIASIIVDKIARLTITSKELLELATDLDLEPIIYEWSDFERFNLQCEIDTIYAHLYGLKKDELTKILDSFLVLKRKEINKYNSFRTKETILKMYDEFSWIKDEIIK